MNLSLASIRQSDRAFFIVVWAVACVFGCASMTPAWCQAPASSEVEQAGDVERQAAASPPAQDPETGGASSSDTAADSAVASPSLHHVEAVNAEIERVTEDASIEEGLRTRILTSLRELRGVLEAEQEASDREAAA